MPGYRIQQHTRHKSAEMVQRYVREADKWTASKAFGRGRVEVEPWARPAPSASAFPKIPGGYRVTDVHGRPLAYVYGVDGSARSALPGALTPAEALAIAAAITRLPEIMPAS